MSRTTIFDAIKKRIETWVGIGVVLVVVLGSALRTEDRIQSDLVELGGSIEKEAELRVQSDDAQAELLDEKLRPIIQQGAELKDGLEFLDQTVQGIEISSTQGDEARALRLEGRLMVVQNAMIELRRAQATIGDSLNSMGDHISQHPDTVRITNTITVRDTVLVKKKGFLSKLNIFN